MKKHHFSMFDIGAAISEKVKLKKIRARVIYDERRTTTNEKGWQQLTSTFTSGKLKPETNAFLKYIAH